MKYFMVPVLFVALFAVLAFNGFVDFVKRLGRKVRKMFGLLGIASVACLVLVTGCAEQDITKSLQIARVSSNIVELTQTWEGNKAVLEKYQAMLPDDDPDYRILENIIVQGDRAAVFLADLKGLGQIPTVRMVRLLFLDADSAVQDGIELYTKYEEVITPPDKFRAKLFSDSWRELRADISGLTRQAEESDRYWLARDVLTTLLQVTGQVIIPTLHATGKI